MTELVEPLQGVKNGLYTKIQSFDRNPFIGCVDRPDKAEIVGQLERSETVGLDAKLGEKTGIGNATQHVWNSNPLRVRTL